MTIDGGDDPALRDSQVHLKMEIWDNYAVAQAGWDMAKEPGRASPGTASLER